MRTIIDGDLTGKLAQIKQAGNTLSNPAVWDGPMASQFRTQTWPSNSGAIDRALRLMQKLRSSSEQVIDNVMKAGDGTLKGVADDGRKVASAFWVIKGGKEAWKLYSNGKLYGSWVKGIVGAAKEVPNLYKDPFDAAAWVRFMTQNRAAEDAIEAFKFGKQGAGVLGTVLGKLGASEEWIGKLGAAKGVLGKVALPLTMVSGAVDMITGGGYSGWRGVADRVMGGVGFAGAGALLFAGALGLGPVGIAIAGAAVLAYGAWSLGNLIWDHHEAIAHAATAAWHWTAGAVSGVAHSAGQLLTAPLRLAPHFHVF